MGDLEVFVENNLEFLDDGRVKIDETGYHYLRTSLHKAGYTPLKTDKMHAKTNEDSIDVFVEMNLQDYQSGFTHFKVQDVNELKEAEKLVQRMYGLQGKLNNYDTKLAPRDAAATAIFSCPFLANFLQGVQASGWWIFAPFAVGGLASYAIRRKLCTKTQERLEQTKQQFIETYNEHLTTNESAYGFALLEGKDS